MRCLVLLALAACSSSEPARPAGPPQLPCPRNVTPEWPWTREVFPACPPSYLPKYFACGATCPRPCRSRETRRIAYDDQQRWIATIPDDPDFTVSCTYDAAGKLDACTRRRGADRIERDARGRITRVSNAEGEQSEYTYDGDRVVAVDDAAFGHSELLYDERGWLAEERGPSGVLVYHYDARGRVAKRVSRSGKTITSHRYDGDRAVEAVDEKRRTTFAYDAQGRLVTALTGEQVVTFAYCE